MERVVLLLIRRHGIPVLLFAAVLFACGVWLLSHIFAEPGKEITVFWGLARYTKPPDKTVAPRTDQALTQMMPGTVDLTTQLDTAEDRTRGVQQELDHLREEVDQLHALLLGRLVNVNYAPGLADLAHRIEAKLEAAGATVVVGEFDPHNRDAEKRFGKLYYRDSALLAKGMAV